LATTTPFLALLFEDNFDQGIRPEWNILNGEVVAVDGRLVAASGQEVTIEVGDDSWGDYVAEFDFSRGTAGMYLIVAKTFRYGFWGANWDVYRNSQWATIAYGPPPPSSGRLRLTIEGNTYTVFVNGQEHQVINYGTSLKGPFGITFYGGQSIDNLTITKP
jgi:hypothetical protein